MSKQKKTIINSKELENAPLLSALQDRNSISVPDGYFDKLEADILSAINSSSIGGSKRTLSYRKMMYYVAAASVVVLLSFFAIRFIDNDSKNDVIVEKHDINLDNTIENNNKNKYPENIYNKDVVVENKTTNNITTFDPKTNLLISNDEINTVEPDIDNTNEINNESSLANNEEENQEQIIGDNYSNDIEMNSINGSAISSVSSASQTQSSTARTIAARISNADGKNILFPKDTCTNDEFVLSIANNSLFDSLIFVWSDNSTKKQFRITKSGIYYVDFYEGEELLYTDTIKVQIVLTPELHIARQIEMCNHQSMLLNTGLNDDIYIHNWSISKSHKSEILLENLDPGMQNLELVVLSCADTVSEIISLNIQDCNIEIPNIITPNGDGYNDIFVIKWLQYYPNSSLNIFDRNGKLLFQSLDYQNDWRAENIPDGTYFYSLIINDDKKTEKGGIIKVLR